MPGEEVSAVGERPGGVDNGWAGCIVNWRGVWEELFRVALM